MTSGVTALAERSSATEGTTGAAAPPTATAATAIADAGVFSPLLSAAAAGVEHGKGDLAARLHADLEARLDALSPDARAGIFEQAFGSKGTDVRASELPPVPVRLVDGATLTGANGAYAADTGTIYLNRDLLADPETLAATYAEEYAHHLDTLAGGGDAQGDEGEIFRLGLLEGGPIGADALARARAEDDTGTLTIDGREVAVEFFDGGDGGSCGTGDSDGSDGCGGGDSASDGGDASDGPGSGACGVGDGGGFDGGFSGPDDSDNGNDDDNRGCDDGVAANGGDQGVDTGVGAGLDGDSDTTSAAGSAAEVADSFAEAAAAGAIADAVTDFGGDDEDENTAPTTTGERPASTAEESAGSMVTDAVTDVVGELDGAFVDAAIESVGGVISDIGGAFSRALDVVSMVEDAAVDASEQRERGTLGYSPDVTTRNAFRAAGLDHWAEPSGPSVIENVLADMGDLFRAGDNPPPAPDPLDRDYWGDQAVDEHIARQEAVDRAMRETLPAWRD